MPKLIPLATVVRGSVELGICSSKSRPNWNFASLTILVPRMEDHRRTATSVFTMSVPLSVRPRDTTCVDWIVFGEFHRCQL